MANPVTVAGEFVKAVNAGDVDLLGRLMTTDHAFIDADGSRHLGRRRMQQAWREYLSLVPDFRIEVLDHFAANETVILLGQADGTFIHDGELRPENHWSVPAAWRVVVDAGLVAVWQLYADQQPMHEILTRIGET